MARWVSTHGAARLFATGATKCVRAPTRPHADAVVGVTFLGERDPDDFSTFCRAFVSMFRITIGRCLSATQLSVLSPVRLVPVSVRCPRCCQPALSTFAPSPRSLALGPGRPHAAACRCRFHICVGRVRTRLLACEVGTESPSQRAVRGITVYAIETPEVVELGLVAYTHARTCARTDARAAPRAHACA